jgi:hypothetical protein
MALTKKRVSVFGVGIDTKADPKLMPAGELVELENMWQKRTGELVQRNGFTTLTTPAAPSTLGLYRLPRSGALGLFRGTSVALPGIVQPLLTPGSGSVAASNQGVAGLPSVVATVRQLTAENASGAGVRDYVDADAAGVGTFVRSAAYSVTAAQTATVAADIGSDSVIATTGTASTTGSRGRTALGGSNYLCAFFMTGAPGTLFSSVYNVSTGAFATQTVAAALVSAAQPWYDVKAIPGGNKIAVAFRNTGGGVTCCIYDPSTNTVTSSVTTGAADATQCLGWLDDSLATGNAYLALAGGTNGIVVQTMSLTTMVISATNTIDAGSTANVRNITGYINASATDYVVLWSVDAAATYNRLIRKGAWTGAAALSDFCRSVSLSSVAFKYNGYYNVVAVYESTTQSTYVVMRSGTTVADVSVPLGMIASGYASGGRTAASNLSTVTVATSANSFYVGLSITQKLTATNGVISFVHAGALVTLTFLSHASPRALGASSLFVPGGAVTVYDGTRQMFAVPPIAVENATLVPSNAAGAMTSNGVYSYVFLYRTVDADGRIMRSPQSVPVSVTLGAADNTVTATMSQLRLLGTAGFGGGSQVVIEVYRAGPAAAGATGYNKVGEGSGSSAVDTGTFVDGMSDANAALGETLYTTGNALDSFPFPPCAVIESVAGRLWSINEEYPTELRYSQEYKQGRGLAAHPNFAIRVEGDSYGRVTALGSLDGRTIAFKSNAIYAITGAGPNSLGQGSFNPPQTVSNNVGVPTLALAPSVVATPDGLMFQSAKGIYLLDRGLGVTYLGAPVEQYTLAENVVDASLVDGYTQVRFVMASGRCLVWDYFQKRWYTWLLRVNGSTVVACGNSSTMGWCYMTADGVVRQEVNGATTDDGTSIIPRIGFPHLSLAGLNGYQRFYAMDIAGEFVGNHTLSVQFEYDSSGVLSTAQTKAIVTGTYAYEVKPGPVAGVSGQRCSRVKPTITLTGTNTAGGFKITGIGMTVGIKKGSNIPYGSRLT